MFRCKECGTEFEIKPEFCDCGNDTFDEIKTVENNEKEIQQTPIAEKKVKKTIKPSEKNSSYNYEYWDKIKEFFDPLSTIIFLLCIALSFYVIFYAWNVVEESADIKQSPNVETVNTQIPSIEKIWNDTPPVVVKVEEQRPIINEIKKIIEPVKKEEIKSKPVLIKNQNVKKQQTIKTGTNNNVKKETVKKSEPVQKQTTVSKPVSTQSTVQHQTINKQELANYKIQLRNRIASRINFANVIGDGSCTVSFSLTNSGQLVNKKFQKQSDNFSLNDVVYNALMKVTSFNPPPTAYNGETLKLNVKMYDGSFEVTLF